MSHGDEPAMEWECGWTQRQDVDTRFWWRSTLENSHLEDQGYGWIQSKWISDLKDGHNGLRIVNRGGLWLLTK